MSSKILITGVLFDMDGTLEDSEPYHYEAYRRCLEQYGLIFTPEDNRKFTGTTDRYICDSLVTAFRLPITAQALLEMKERMLVSVNTHPTPLPGVVELITTLRQRGIKMGVASSSTLSCIDMILTRLKLKHYFDIIASGEEVIRSKPFPDVYTLGATRLGMEPQNLLAVEDSGNGVRAAKQAGLTCIAVPCSLTLNDDHSPADVILTSLQEISFTDDSLIAGHRIFRLMSSSRQWLSLNA